MSGEANEHAILSFPETKKVKREESNFPVITKEREEFLDTNDIDVQVFRVSNQRTVEQEMPHFFDHAAIYRMIHTRQLLFSGLPNVRGDMYGLTRTANVGFESIKLPSAEFVQQNFARFVELLDQLQMKIRSLPVEEKSEAALRLASISYALGIALHPYIDGNGQTFRMLSLSYLHEFSSTLKDYYLPYRINRSRTVKAIHPELFENLPANDHPDFELFKKVQSLLDKMPTMPVDNTFTDQHNRWFHEVKSLVPTAGDPNIAANQLETIVDTLAEKMVGPGKKKQDVYRTPERKIEDYLTYLFDEKNKPFLEQYIQGENTMNNAYEQLAVQTFGSIESQIVNLLEDPQTHKQQFENLMQEYIPNATPMTYLMQQAA